VVRAADSEAAFSGGGIGGGSWKWQMSWRRAAEILPGGRCLSSARVSARMRVHMLCVYACICLWCVLYGVWCVVCVMCARKPAVLADVLADDSRL